MTKAWQKTERCSSQHSLSTTYDIDPFRIADHGVEEWTKADQGGGKQPLLWVSYHDEEAAAAVTNHEAGSVAKGVETAAAAVTFKPKYITKGLDRFDSTMMVNVTMVRPADVNSIPQQKAFLLPPGESEGEIITFRSADKLVGFDLALPAERKVAIEFIDGFLRNHRNFDGGFKIVSLEQHFTAVHQHWQTARVLATGWKVAIKFERPQKLLPNTFPWPSASGHLDDTINLVWLTRGKHVVHYGTDEVIQSDKGGPLLSGWNAIGQERAPQGGGAAARARAAGKAKSAQRTHERKQRKREHRDAAASRTSETRPMCKFFAASGGCRNGNDCWFRHGEASSSAGPGPAPRPSPKRKAGDEIEDGEITERPSRAPRNREDRWADRDEHDSDMDTDLR